MTPDEIRDTFVRVAKAYVGLTTEDTPPGMREQYLDVVGPAETPTMRQNMVKMSGCALVTAGVWRAVGVRHSRLDPPYKVGSAVARLVQIARELNCWVPYKAGALPQPGDAVLIGDGTPAGGIEHVYTVTEVDASGPHPVVYSVDGGQVNAHGFQCIKALSRVWRGGRDVGFAGTDPGAAKGVGRVIIGWVDVTQLPLEGDTGH